MREILFRGKTKRNEWIYGDLITHGIDFDDAIKQHHTREVWDIKQETVGQFTGLTDVNGKKVFEGDIVSINKLLGVYVVKYDCEQCRFSMYKDGIYEQAGFNKDTIKNYEVIGNIYENPELLKGE